MILLLRGEVSLSCCEGCAQLYTFYYPFPVKKCVHHPHLTRLLCAVVALRPLNPLLTPLLRVTVVLQAAAASRIAGRGDIFKAAKDGDLELVRDYVAADPASVHKRDEEYDSHP